MVVNRLFVKYSQLRKKLKNKVLVKKSYRLSLGDQGEPWEGYISLGLNPDATIWHDVTKPFPKELDDKFDFIWSERMLEHVEADQLPEFFKNLAEILKVGARARFCLPICF